MYKKIATSALWIVYYNLTHEFAMAYGERRYDEALEYDELCSEVYKEIKSR